MHNNNNQLPQNSQVKSPTKLVIRPSKTYHESSIQLEQEQDERDVNNSVHNYKVEHCVSQIKNDNNHNIGQNSNQSSVANLNKNKDKADIKSSYKLMGDICKDKKVHPNNNQSSWSLNDCYQWISCGHNKLDCVSMKDVHKKENYEVIYSPQSSTQKQKNGKSFGFG